MYTFERYFKNKCISISLSDLILSGHILTDGVRIETQSLTYWLMSLLPEKKIASVCCSILSLAPRRSARGGFSGVKEKRQQPGPVGQLN